MNYFQDKSTVDKRGKIIVDDGKTSLSKYYKKEKKDKKKKVDIGLFFIL